MGDEGYGRGVVVVVVVVVWTGLDDGGKENTGIAPAGYLHPLPGYLLP